MLGNDHFRIGARKFFAEKGFERTTIRAVAAAASVDPALVMQYFDSKRALFSQAVQAFPAPTTTTDDDALVDHLLTSLGLKLGGLPEGTLAMMRSMLTDQTAAEHVRVALGRQIDSVGAALPAPRSPSCAPRWSSPPCWASPSTTSSSVWPRFATFPPIASPPCSARPSKP
ncbi:helix-turn-helix domain-containing protein [Streptomyces sp. NPDC005426]|uniref:TetR/AcrR family transcriptional regulator n=1 Tax=Streptomyces sp. NPDC005426 TaxID=3155344 RepID=UPI0033A80E23